MHMSPSSCISLLSPFPFHPSRWSQSPPFEFPESYSQFPLATYFTFGIVNFHVTLSIHFTLSLFPSHHVHKSVPCVCVSIQFSSVHFLVVSNSLRPHEPQHARPRCPSPTPVHHQLWEFTQTHVHRVSDAIQPSNPLSSPSSAFNPSQHRCLFQ